jgi:hypothetical protein
MKTLDVYDPAMCCGTGVCGPSVDPLLARFAADLHWLSAQGFTVRRYNLASEPGAFATNALVREALQAEGNECLPMILCDGEVVSKGLYPTRNALARRVGAEVATLKVAAAPAPSCEPGAEGSSGTGCC